jgi:glucuronoarabinoxylan endo-1,4-beta-xylanase
MNTNSNVTLGLALALVACSQAGSSPSPGTPDTGDTGANAGRGVTTGGTGAITATSGSSGTNTVVGNGSTTGGTTSGTAGGGTSGGSSGAGTASGGSSAGRAGSPSTSGGNSAGGDMSGTSGGMTSAAAGGSGMSSGGMSTAGAGSGSGGAAGANNTGPVTVELATTHQKIEGFGINDTYASSTLPSSLFDATNGIGLTILRVGMNSSGSLLTSSVQMSDISMVKGISGTKIIGSCWTAPANCKSNNSENDGGHLNMSCYTSWATTITNFAKTNGLYAMSVGNEPDFASCGTDDPCNGHYPTMLYTANEMVAFVKVVGPMLQSAGVKVIAPESSEWNHLWSNVSAGPDPGGKNSSDPLKCGFPPSNSACDTGGGYDYGHYLAKDSAAWAAFDIVGTHQYDSQEAYAWPSDVTAAKKEVWQTEMSGVKWWPEQGPSSDIANGIAVAGWIHDALTIGDASAWLWWWYSTTGDNEGLMLGSTDTKRHYTLGNYSKFVRPGYTRVEVGGAVPAGVLLSAYAGTDGTVVVVAINKNTSDTSVPITINGGSAPSMMTPWVTSSMDDLASKTAVAVTNGAFTAALGASTVTTFVGK